MDRSHSRNQSRDVARFELGAVSSSATGMTRRRVLRLGTAAAAAGGVGAVVGGAKPAAAGSDGDVVLGGTNTTSLSTAIVMSGSPAYGFAVDDNGASFNGVTPAIFAHAKNSSLDTALLAMNEGTGDAIVANATSGDAVSATSTSGNAVRAHAFTGTSLLAQCESGTAISAFNGNLARIGADTVVVHQAGIGVAIHVISDWSQNSSPAIQIDMTSHGSAIAATGAPTASNPTIAASSSSAALPAIAATGKAIPAGPGVAVAGNDAALSVTGIASFTRSGVATVATGASEVVVKVPGGLTASSHVLATAQSDVGTVALRAAVPGVATGKVTILLTEAAPAAVKVAWFVFG